MPLPLIDFASAIQGAKGQSLGLGDLVSNYYKGYELGQTPEKLARQKLQEELANQIMGVQAQYAEPMAELGLNKGYADLEYANLENQYYGRSKEAEIAEMLARAQQHKFYNPFSGEAGNVFALEQFGGQLPPGVADQVRKQIELQQRNTESNIEQRNQVNRFRAFNSLSARDKANLIAGFRTLGFDEDEAVDAIVNDNRNLYQTARDLGYSEEQARNLEKTYAPTESTITDIQRATGAQAESQSLESFITHGMKPYARKFAGYSPKQIIDSFKTDGKSEEQMSDFLAARALSLENTAARIRQAGLSDAEKIVRALNDKSLNNVKAFESLVSPRVYELTQQKITRELNKAADARIKALKGQKIQEVAAQLQAPFETVKLINPSTGQPEEVPISRLSPKQRAEYEKRKKK